LDTSTINIAERVKDARRDAKLTQTELGKRIGKSKQWVSELERGNIKLSFEDRDFTIEAQGWSDYTVDYTQIDSISYEENPSQNRNDYRTNGLGNLKYAMGNFRNDVYGDYIRYTHSSCHSYVVMSINGKILVVNGANDSATKEIYHTISEKVSNELK